MFYDKLNKKNLGDFMTCTTRKCYGNDFVLFLYVCEVQNVDNTNFQNIVWRQVCELYATTSSVSAGDTNY